MNLLFSALHLHRKLVRFKPKARGVLNYLAAHLAHVELKTNGSEHDQQAQKNHCSVKQVHAAQYAFKLCGIFAELCGFDHFASGVSAACLAATW